MVSSPWLLLAKLLFVCRISILECWLSRCAVEVDILHPRRPNGFIGNLPKHLEPSQLLLPRARVMGRLSVSVILIFCPSDDFVTIRGCHEGKTLARSAKHILHPAPWHLQGTTRYATSCQSRALFRELAHLPSFLNVVNLSASECITQRFYILVCMHSYYGLTHYKRSWLRVLFSDGARTEAWSLQYLLFSYTQTRS